MNKVLWIVFGVVIVAGLAALVVFSNQEKETDPNTNIDVTLFDFKEIITADNIPGDFKGDNEIVIDHIEGKVDSKVRFIEWQNYQCSACYSLSPGMREVFEEYKDRVAFVYRYLYLSGHPNGLAASVTAEAARLQGKFREMNDMLFSSYYEWGEAKANEREGVFAKYAENIGLDIEKWREDYRNYETNGIKFRLDFQNNLGKDAFKQLGISGYSPFILVNGDVIDSKDTKNNVINALKKALGES